MINEESSISVIFANTPTACANILLNPNAFPGHARSESISAGRRFAVFLQNATTLRAEIDRAVADFFLRLQEQWTDLVSAARRRPALEVVAYSDGLPYLSSLHSVLYELKAFLDLYTRLLCKLIATSGGPVGFSKAKVNGVKLAGGRVINWLSSQSIESLPHRENLRDRILAASNDWITPAVGIRDTLAHFRDLPGFRHMRVSVPHGPETISPSDISRPEMPNGTQIDDYASELCIQLGEFVATTVALAPQVDNTLLKPWDRAARVLRE